MTARHGLLATCAALLVAAMGVPANAAKHLYKCIDDQGRVVFSDAPCPVQPLRPGPEPKLPCPLTKEEVQAALHEEVQFLNRYPTAADYLRAQRAELEPETSALLTLNARLAEIRRENDAIMIELEFYRRAASIPVALAHRVEANVSQNNALTNLFHAVEERLRRLESRWDCDVGRYAVLWAGGAAGSSACAASCASR